MRKSKYDKTIKWLKKLNFKQDKSYSYLEPSIPRRI